MIVPASTEHAVPGDFATQKAPSAQTTTGDNHTFREEHSSIEAKSFVDQKHHVALPVQNPTLSEVRSPPTHPQTFVPARPLGFCCVVGSFRVVVRLLVIKVIKLTWAKMLLVI